MHINIKKSITFLYTSKEQMEFEIKNIIPLMLLPINKILGINLTKYVQDLRKTTKLRLMKSKKNYINKEIFHVRE